MSHWPRRLSLRLALMFALVSMLVLGLLGTYLYHSLARELAWRDDQALLGRLQRMQALLADSAGIQALQQRPALYENMLGNRDSLLWLLDAQGQALIRQRTATHAASQSPAAPDKCHRPRRPAPGLANPGQPARPTHPDRRTQPR